MNTLNSIEKTLESFQEEISELLNCYIRDFEDLRRQSYKVDFKLVETEKSYALFPFKQEYFIDLGEYLLDILVPGIERMWNDNGNKPVFITHKQLATLFSMIMKVKEDAVIFFVLEFLNMFNHTLRKVPASWWHADAPDHESWEYLFIRFSDTDWPQHVNANLEKFKLFETRFKRLKLKRKVKKLLSQYRGSKLQ